MKVAEKVLAKLQDLCNKIDDRVTDDDSVRIAKTIRGIFAALQKLSVKVPGIGPYRYLIDLVILLCSAVEDDGDLTEKDLRNLVQNYKVVIEAAKSLRSL